MPSLSTWCGFIVPLLLLLLLWSLSLPICFLSSDATTLETSDSIPGGFSSDFWFSSSTVLCTWGLDAASESLLKQAKGQKFKLLSTCTLYYMHFLLTIPNKPSCRMEYIHLLQYEENLKSENRLLQFKCTQPKACMKEHGRTIKEMLSPHINSRKTVAHNYSFE